MLDRVTGSGIWRNLRRIRARTLIETYQDRVSAEITSAGPLLQSGVQIIGVEGPVAVIDEGVGVVVRTSRVDGCAIDRTTADLREIKIKNRESTYPLQGSLQRAGGSLGVNIADPVLLGITLVTKS